MYFFRFFYLAIFGKLDTFVLQIEKILLIYLSYSIPILKKTIDFENF